METKKQKDPACRPPAGRAGQAGFAPLLIILIIAILGAGTFLGYKYTFKQNVQKTITPAPYPLETIDPTANWKTYTSTKYKFSVKLPKNFIIHDNNPGLIIFEDDCKDYGCLFQLRIEIEEVGNIGLEQWVDTKENYYPSGINYQPKQEIIIGGLKGIRRSGSNKDTSWGKEEFVWIWTTNDNFKYKFSSSFTDFNSHKKYYFDQILSTFKFTN